MSAEQPSKRRRASELGLLSAPPLQGWQQPGAGGGTPAAAAGDAADTADLLAEPRPDVFEFLSQRSQRQRDLETAVAQLQRREAELAGQLSEAQRQIAGLRTEQAGAAARYEAQEAQLLLRCREQEDALQREVERAARLQAQLRMAQEAAEAAAAAPLPPPGHGDEGPPGTLADAQRAQQLQLRVTELELELQRAAAEREEADACAAQELSTQRQRHQAEVENSRWAHRACVRQMCTAAPVHANRQGRGSQQPPCCLTQQLGVLPPGLGAAWAQPHTAAPPSPCALPSSCAAAGCLQRSWRRRCHPRRALHGRSTRWRAGRQSWSAAWCRRRRSSPRCRRAAAVCVAGRMQVGWCVSDDAAAGLGSGPSAAHLPHQCRIWPCCCFKSKPPALLFPRQLC